MSEAIRSEWWVVVLGDHLSWARLDELDNGHAHILAADGVTRQFVDIESAHAELLDADYRDFDGLDDDDAESLGFDLDSVAPPHANDDETLLKLMNQRLPGKPLE